ncbi:MAG: HEAT repeat domain-containing protein [Pseudomonadota bacterium]
MHRLMAVGISVLFLVASGNARAQMTGNVDRLKADLYGDDLDRGVAAASALGSLKDPNARDALIIGLQLGAPAKLLSAMLEALGLHKSPNSVDLLKTFVSNRNPEIRISALKAMAGIEGPRTTDIVIKALGDSNPMVRARAARILGERAERKATSSLLKMLIRGDRSAAAPLGEVGGAETAKQLAELLGEVPDSALAIAFGEMLKRKDFGPDPLRTEVVKTLGKIPGAESTAALVEYISDVPEKEDRLSKKAAEKILQGRKK